MEMEWATLWLGAEGKVHADKRTVEYCGRGNHSADAVCVIGSNSVGNVCETRAHAMNKASERSAACLTSPFEVSAVSTDAAVRSTASGALEVDGSEGNGEKPAKNHTDIKWKKSHKKRRVEQSDGREEQEQEDEKASIPELRVPVYYYEVQILATRHFQGTTSTANSGVGRHSRWLSADEFDHSNRDGDQDQEMKNDASGSGMDDADDSDDGDGNLSMDVDVDVDMMAHSLMGSGDAARAPWRGRARRLIRAHLRASAQGDGEAAGAVTGDGPASRSRPSASSPSPSASNGNANGSQSGPHNQGVRSSSISTVLAPGSFFAPLPPPPVSSGQQEHLHSFPLSSSTIEQIRFRLERQQQQVQSQRRRSTSSSSTTTTSPPLQAASFGSMPLATAISSLHTRQQRGSPAVRRRRSNHCIAVGFMFDKDDGCDHHKRALCHDELGRQACSIALVGKTGSILSNGQTYLEPKATFGHGDIVGCGVILDTRTFFWTVNGRVVATLAATDVHHLDDYEDHAMDSEDGICDSDWRTAWADQLVPAVSLHENGECVRALFTPSSVETFRFDLDAFKQQQLRERQSALATYASGSSNRTDLPKPLSVRPDDEIMHQLVQDYFSHYGYGTALSALQNLHQGDHCSSLKTSDSIQFRHGIRQLIYAFKTREALGKLETKWIDGCDAELKLFCRLLCVVDVLHASKSSKERDTVSDAITAAQEFLQSYLPPTDGDSVLTHHVNAFMSVLLYPSVSEIPSTCPGRRFLAWGFREQVADLVNASLLDGKRSSSPRSSALETLADDLSELQRQCLGCGASPFPPCSSGGNPLASCFSCGRRRSHAHHRTCQGVRMAGESGDDHGDDASGSSSCDSSASSENEDDDEDDD